MNVHKPVNQSSEWIDGIKRNDNETVRRIYKMYYSKIKSMVNQYRIRHLEPEDVFQEGLTRAVINIRQGLFRGDSTFYVYLYGICRNLCLKEYSKYSKEDPLDEQFEAEDLNDDRFKLLHRILELRHKLEPACQQIIDLRFCQAPMEDFTDKCMSFEKIAEVLQIRADNARQRFKRCMERFSELARRDREIYELI